MWFDLKSSPLPHMLKLVFNITLKAMLFLDKWKFVFLRVNNKCAIIYCLLKNSIVSNFFLATPSTLKWLCPKISLLTLSASRHQLHLRLCASSILSQLNILFPSCQKQSVFFLGKRSVYIEGMKPTFVKWHQDRFLRLPYISNDIGSTPNVNAWYNIVLALILCHFPFP